MYLKDSKIIVIKIGSSLIVDKKNKLILTGGYSKFFKSKINTKSTLNPDITLLGLITLIKRNKKIFNVNK